ncbi:MAG TPA: hypothetical protein VNL95_08155 [Dehalococcoidia bacterium]|nr:hypothetical protein [Dehalococcoidia bacterium]
MPPSATPTWAEVPLEEWQAAARQRQEEAAKPPFVGTINGVTLGQGDGAERCSGKLEWHHDWQVAQGTPYDIQPGHLPAGAKEIWYTDPVPPIITCDGQVKSATRAWVVGGVGTLIIIKQSNPERRFEGLYPADRVRAATVGGRPAVVVEPMRRDGFMSTTVVFFPEPWGLTVVVGESLPYEETLRVAESLG